MSPPPKTPLETREERDKRILAERAERDCAVLGAPLVAPSVARPSDLPIGFDINGNNFYVSLDARRRHEVILGLSGTGKSRAIEHRVRHDIRQGYGVTVIDPKGNSPDSVFNNTLRWLHAEGYCGDAPMRPKRTVRIIDLSSDTHTTCLNPFHVTDDVRKRADPRKLAEDLVSVFEAVWCREFQDTPTIAKLLPALFVGLYENELRLADLPRLFARTDDLDGNRLLFIRRMEHELSKINLEEVHAYSEERSRQRQFGDDLRGPLNRLEPFIGGRVINRMFSAGAVPLDLRRIMDNGEILLVNLGKDAYSVSEKTARLVGTFLVHEFYRLAMERTETARRQHFLYIDEAASFLTDEVARSLDECRSQGLSFILALQRLQQAKDASDNILSAVVSEPNILSVFGGLEMNEAEYIARNIVKFDLERPIQATIKPTPTGEFEIIELRSSSTSQTDNLSYTDAVIHAQMYVQTKSHMTSGASHRSFGDIMSAGESISTILDGAGNPIVVMNNVAGSSAAYGDMTGWGKVEGIAQSETTGNSFAASHGTSTGASSATNQSLKPLFADMVNGVHSIQNVHYAAAYAIRTQQPRHFFLSVDRQNAIRLAVPTVTAPALSAELMKDFKRSLHEADPSSITIEEADTELADRLFAIQAAVTKPKHEDAIGIDISALEDPAPMPHQPRDDELPSNVVPLRPASDEDEA